MDEINDLLGFGEEEIKIEFLRIWRLAISGLNCRSRPQINMDDGVVLPSAFDLRDEVGKKKEQEKYLSFMKLDIDGHDLKSDEEKHMEIMATTFNKNTPNDLRKTRCSITITREKIFEAIASDPLNRKLIERFNFLETPNGSKLSKFSSAKGMHWEGHFLSQNTSEIINIKSMFSKCARIVLP